MEEAVENQRSMNVSAGNSQLDTNISFFFQTYKLFLSTRLRLLLTSPKPQNETTDLK